MVLRFRQQLSESVRKVIDGINIIHESNMDNDQPEGIPFLSSVTIYWRPLRYITSSSGSGNNIRTQLTSGDPLDGSIALAIADFIEGTHNDYLEHLAGWTLCSKCLTGISPKNGSYCRRLGIDAQKVESGFSTQELLVKELANRKDSISGVSLDEEITNLIREQHAFNAASRVITVADEMLDTIINRMGLGGR